MLLIRISEIAMLIGGIYAIFSAKVPSFLVSGGKYKVEGVVARWIGVLLILPLPIAFLGGTILPLLLGTDSAQYAAMAAVLLELITVLGVAILSLVLMRVMGKRVEPAETPTKTSPLQLTLYLVMAVTLILGIWLRLIHVGWFLVFLFIPLLWVAAAHLMTQVRAIRRVSKMEPSYIYLILFSNLFFFLGFALQADFGDTVETSYSGSTIISVLSFVALFVSWYYLREENFHKLSNSD